MAYQSSKKTFYKKAFAVSWTIVCISIFMIYPARLSVVHGSSLGSFQAITTKLTEIPLATYIANLLISFLEILLFSLACIIGGILPVSAVLAYDDVNFRKSTAVLTILLGSSFLVGHWLFSTTFLFLAIFNLLNPLSTILALALGSSVGFHPASKLWQLFKKRSGDKPNNISEEKYRIIYWLAISALFASLLYSTSRLSYDSVALYFSDAKIIALAKGFQFFQGNSFLLSSLQTGIQFSAIMQLFDDQAARMFSWVSGCVMLIFGLATAEKVGVSSRAKGIFLALMLTSTAFTDLLGDGKVDLTSSAVALAAIYWVLCNDNKAHKLLAGFLAGLAMVSRPYNVFLLSVFIGSIYLLKIYHSRKNGKHLGVDTFAKSILWIGLGGTLPLVFHLAANWAVYGTPLAMLTDAQIMTTGNWQWAFDPQYIWLMRALYPFVVTFLNTSQSIGNISPVFLAFLPYILFNEIRKKISLSRSLTELLIAAQITLVLWITLFFTIMEIRYIFFLWVIFFIAISEVIVVVLDNNENILRGLLSALLIGLLGFTILRTVYLSVNTYSPLDKQGNPQCKDFIFCDYLKPINDNAPPGERVLSLLAFRYYLRTDLFACSTKMEEYSKLYNASLQSPNKFWVEVYHQGYTYVAYEKNYTIRHLYMEFIPDPSNTPAWMELEPIYGEPGDNAVAYKIIVKKPPVLRTMACVKMEETGIWEVQAVNSNQ